MKEHYLHYYHHFFTDVRYRALSISFNISVSIFGGTTPLVCSYLVHATGNPLAPAFYLTGVSIIGLVVFSVLFVTTSGRALKGSYPTVESKKHTKLLKKILKKHFGGMKSH